MYLLNGYRGLVPGTLEKRKKTNPNIAQKARASKGEDEVIVFKHFHWQRLL